MSPLLSLEAATKLGRGSKKEHLLKNRSCFAWCFAICNCPWHYWYNPTQQEMLKSQVLYCESQSNPVWEMAQVQWSKLKRFLFFKMMIQCIYFDKQKALCHHKAVMIFWKYGLTGGAHCNFISSYLRWGQALSDKHFDETTHELNIIVLEKQ